MLSVSLLHFVLGDQLKFTMQFCNSEHRSSQYCPTIVDLHITVLKYVNNPKFDNIF